MKTLFAGTVAIFLMVCSAHARLGETQEQIAQRYGQPIPEITWLLDYDDKGHWGTFYHVNNYVVTVVFDAELLSVREAYSRWDRLPLTETEMRMFLDANDGGHAWRQVSDPDAPGPDTLHWRRTDNQARAFYNGIWKVFVVKRMTPPAPANHAGHSQPTF